MSAGFVRGAGFIPQARLWRRLLSGWACGIALIQALLIYWVGYIGRESRPGFLGEWQARPLTCFIYPNS